MQKNEILQFLLRIDAHLRNECLAQLNGRKFELKIFGKSALLLAGLSDSLGTVDIDLLKVEGEAPQVNNEIMASLETEFGRRKVKVNGYFLEFVSPSFVTLPAILSWRSIEGNYQNLNAHYLETDYVIASKLFSAFSDTPRKRDKQDIVAALDQKMVTLKRICEIADQIFERYKFDSRSDRYTDVYNYISNELMPNYGDVRLAYHPDE
jgi:hypothetical protein